jgi:tryptophan synthase alpha subunit
MNPRDDMIANRYSALTPVIKEANRQGRLGLIVYLVPGYPDLQRYNEVRKTLEEKDFVTIIETTVPVTGDFCTASAAIIKAHRTASEVLKGNLTLSLLETHKPNFAVLYRQTVARLGLDGFLKQFAPVLNAGALEWEEHDEPYYADAFAKHGMEYIIGVTPSMSADEVKHAMRLALADGMIYLSCARMTGAAMDDLSDIRRCAERIEQMQPTTTVAAGMGIKNASDIMKISSIREIDAVVVGTAFLQALGRGRYATDQFLNEIEPALYRNP